MTRYVDDAPLTVEEENQQQNTGLYRAMIIAVAVILLFLARWALVRLNRKIRDIREAFGPTLQRILRITFLLVVFIFAIIFFINFLGKQMEWRKKK